MDSAGIIISSPGEEIVPHLQANTKIPQIAERCAESRFQASLGELLQVVLAIEGTIGHQIGGAGGGVQRRKVSPDDVAERCEGV
jgi:hypothetical protein